MLRRQGATSRPLLWDRRDRALIPRQRVEKAKFLHALSLARQRKTSLEKALKDLGLDPRQVVRKTHAVKRLGGELVPKVRDHVPRSLKIYEKGKLVHVEVVNSEVASDIGRYWSAIAKLTETGKSTALRRLRRQRFKATDGTIHTLEKNPKIILELEARRPEPERFEIYRR
jgi:hypothetical protein